MLDPVLLSALEEEALSRLPVPALREAARLLTDTYQQGRSNPMLNEATATAYLLIRFPATYAAVEAALAEAILRIPGFRPRTQLDLGSGPGTAAFAAASLIEPLESIIAMERYPLFRALAAAVATRHGEFQQRVEWREGDFLSPADLPAADLVTMAYALGEAPREQRGAAVTRAWRAAGQALVIVEPGTPAGFETVLAARDLLIAMGAKIAAPCPHAKRCSLADGPGWCHFPRRLSRSKLHRLLKDATLGWEDEKFAFIVASRQPTEPAAVRALSEAAHSKVAIRFDACTRRGFEGIEIPRRDKELWRIARKVQWGDGLGGGEE